MLFVAVLLVNYLIGDGKSHWLEGVMLMMMYLIIAIAAWYVLTVTKTALSKKWVCMYLLTQAGSSDLTGSLLACGFLIRDSPPCIISSLIF